MQLLNVVDNAATSENTIGHASFTRWLRHDSARMWEQCFSIPTASERKKYKPIWLLQLRLERSHPT